MADLPISWNRRLSGNVRLRANLFGDPAEAVERQPRTGVASLHGDTEPRQSRKKSRGTLSHTDAAQELFLPLAPPSWCIERGLWPYHTDAWQVWLAARRRGKDMQTPEEAALDSRR
jgi:fermentation-respiration switch protein FrsA (DUF1100 family)